MSSFERGKTASKIYQIIFKLVKYILVTLNILQIAFSVWFLSYGISMINKQVQEETDEKKLQNLEVNRTVIILSGVITSIFCLVGLIGSIRESFACTVAFTMILLLLFIASIFSPGKSKYLNILIIFSLTLVSAVFTTMLRLRVKPSSQTSTPIDRDKCLLDDLKEPIVLVAWYFIIHHHTNIYAHVLRAISHLLQLQWLECKWKWLTFLLFLLFYFILKSHQHVQHQEKNSREKKINQLHFWCRKKCHQLH